jgi:hypothetical protein
LQLASQCAKVYLKLSQHSFQQKGFFQTLHTVNNLASLTKEESFNKKPFSLSFSIIKLLNGLSPKIALYKNNWQAHLFEDKSFACISMVNYSFQITKLGSLIKLLQTNHLLQ